MKLTSLHEDASPTKFFHGSPKSGLKEIQPYHGDWGYGVYLTDNMEIAIHYSRGRAKMARFMLGDITKEPSTGSIYEVVPDIRNPLIIQTREQLQDLYGETVEVFDPEGEGKNDRFADTPEGIGRLAKRKGHDAIIDLVSHEHIVFTDKPIPVTSEVTPAEFASK
jgi:hypothetical protein